MSDTRKTVRMRLLIVPPQARVSKYQIQASNATMTVYVQRKEILHAT